jgi:hypothetical protein
MELLRILRNYNGLELEFDFDITPDAEVEVRFGSNQVNKNERKDLSVI